MSNFSPPNTKGFFLEVNKDFPEGWDEFLEKFLDSYRDIANAVNIREVSLYDTSEISAGQRYFPSATSINTSRLYRQTFRQVYTFTGLGGSGATTTIPHNIIFPSPNTLHFTHMYGVAEDLTAFLYYPIPNFDLDLRISGGTGGDIEITPQSGRYVGFDGTIVLEYLKN